MQHKVRQSQTVTPFGVGAIMTTLSETFVCCDTTFWGQNDGDAIYLDRLAANLNVSGFRSAPVAPEYGSSSNSYPGVPFQRFPEQMFCPKCRTIARISTRENDERPTCTENYCSGSENLVPMRFVQICSNGHLGDVNWWYWAHTESSTGERCANYKERLEFKIDRQAGGGLRSLVIKAECGRERSLDKIAGADALKHVGVQCSGGQPWERNTPDCDQTPQVVQSGASNVHYAKIASALDIPPASDFNSSIPEPELVRQHDLFNVILNHGITRGELNDVGNSAVDAVAAGVALPGNRVEEIVMEAWLEQQGRSAGPTHPESDIEHGEYLAFLHDRGDRDQERDRFITQHTALEGEGGGATADLVSSVDGLITTVVKAIKLREVRAMTGFTRLEPGGETVTVLPPSLDTRLDWLPAVEVYGEGLFLGFNEALMQEWENEPTVAQRLSKTNEIWLTSASEWLPEPTPRYVVLHTLAHLLIRQLTFECGYSSASLREKIYARPPSDENQPMAGLLIYTAAGDAEGSLGGLIRQADPPRLIRTLASAVSNASWCSADPVCSEIRSGNAGLNAAACHACSLVAETSCAGGNLLLDRVLITGDSEVPGLFAKLATAVLSTSLSNGPE